MDAGFPLHRPLCLTFITRLDFHFLAYWLRIGIFSIHLLQFYHLIIPSPSSPSVSSMTILTKLPRAPIAGIVSIPTLFEYILCPYILRVVYMLISYKKYYYRYYTIGIYIYIIFVRILRILCVLCYLDRKSNEGGKWDGVDWVGRRSRSDRRPSKKR